MMKPLKHIEAMDHQLLWDEPNKNHDFSCFKAIFLGEVSEVSEASSPPRASLPRQEPRRRLLRLLQLQAAAADQRRSEVLLRRMGPAGPRISKHRALPAW